MSNDGVSMSSEYSGPLGLSATERFGGMIDALDISVSPRRRSTAYQCVLSGSIRSTYAPGASTVAFCTLVPPVIGVPRGMYWRKARVASVCSSWRRSAALLASR